MTARSPYVRMDLEYEMFGDALRAAFHRVLSAGDFILRGDVAEFERRIRELSGAQHCVAVGSGYDALFLSLSSLALAPGDEVVLPSYTFTATAAAVVQAGGVPVFADIRDDLNIDPEDAARRVTRKTRAIIPVHLNGVPCDMDAILTLAREHRLAVVEDAAQAIASTLDGRWLGSWGDYGCFSLHPLKTLSVPGDGGFVLTRRAEDADALRRLRDHGRLHGQYSSHGVNSRLDNLHAALANVKLQRFSELTEGRREAAAAYALRLEGVPGVRTLVEPPGARVVWSNYPVLLRNADRMAEALAEGGVEVFRHFSTPVHRLPMYADRRISLPATEELCGQAVHLPMHPFLTVENIELATNIIRRNAT